MRDEAKSTSGWYGEAIITDEREYDLVVVLTAVAFLLLAFVRESLGFLSGAGVVGGIVAIGSGVGRAFDGLEGGHGSLDLGFVVVFVEIPRVGVLFGSGEGRWVLAFDSGLMRWPW
jgi:hypothetical protein